MSKGLFFTVMEAEGDEMQPFDAGAPADAPTADTPSEDIAPPATDDSGGGDALDSPPELSESGDDSMDFMGGGEGDDNNGDDTGGGDTSGNEDDADKKDEKLADKANNILNERLYKQFVNRNNEIEEIGVHSRRTILFRKEIPELDKYLISVLNDFFKAQRLVLTELDKCKVEK